MVCSCPGKNHESICLGEKTLLVARQTKKYIYMEKYEFIKPEHEIQ